MSKLNVFSDRNSFVYSAPSKMPIRLLKLFVLPLQRVSLISILLLVFLACQMDNELNTDQGISPEKEKKNELIRSDNIIGKYIEEIRIRGKMFLKELPSITVKY